MSDGRKRVECDRHGQTPAAFVCQHLLGGVACGYHGSDEDEADPWPDAWCDLCEATFQRDGEWTDANEPKINLLCTGCYEEARERNERLLPPLHPGQLAVTEHELQALAQEAFSRCDLRQEQVKQLWPAFSEAERWFYDDESRTIRFFDDPAKVFLVADVTIVGSLSTRSNTWLWSWGNEQYGPRDIGHMGRLRVFGEVRGIERFHQPLWSAEEVDAWEVTQIAAELLGAEAIYRMPLDHLFVFLLLDNFREQAAD